MDRRLSVHGSRGSLLLGLGALGVVYGDIGTSPLYALKETFYGHYPLERSPENVLGVLSLFFWSLIIVITFKYVFLIMRADNHGEGGIFALLGLIKKGRGHITPKAYLVISNLILVGAALLYGDGAITPAISVLSAIEGIEIITPTLKSLVLPITVVILFALFAIQRYGTHRVGNFFGPVMCVWFLALAALGIPQIIANPSVLFAVDPRHAISFAFHHGWHMLFTLGAVVLCVTGGEALYADMGHFGGKIIRNIWLGFVFPALLINYFGQGARLLNIAEIPGGNLFYSIVPDMLLVPMVLLATFATVIASQALISGCYSITQQAISLGVFPRLRIIHTNRDIEGQIYVPFINWSLLAACLALVFGFQTSSALAAAYGIAVTGTMAITTFAFFVVAKYIWGWKSWIAPVCGLLVGIDLLFYVANSLKFLEGGFVPVVIAAILFIVMNDWEWGRALVRSVYENLPGFTVGAFLEEKKIRHVPNRSVVVLNSIPLRGTSDKIPPQLQAFFSRWQIIPRHIIVLTLVERHQPFVSRKNRFALHKIQEDESGTFVGVEVHFGYMQFPRVREVLKELKSQGLIKIPEDPSHWLILVGQERFVTEGKVFIDRMRIRLYRFLLANANPATSYFDLDRDVNVSIEERNV